MKDLAEAPEDLWFQKEDFDGFREKTRRIVNNVDENGRGIKNGKKYCTRGLEKYITPTGERRKNIRKQVLRALEDGDDVSISNLSDTCISEALERAEGDAKVAGSHTKRLLPRWR
jgi:hypothetical protein